MTLFILISVLLVLLLFAIALKPLWLKQRGLAGALLLGCAGLTAGLYWQFGRPEAIGYQAPQAAEQTIEQALAELETVVREQPANLEARVLLARSYLQTGQYQTAQPHFAEALKLAPDNAGLMVDYAESIFRAGKPEVPDARAREWIDKALSFEPDNQRARFFSGILLLQAGQAKDAAAVWESLLPQVDATTAQALLPQINRARVDAGLPAMAMPSVRVVSIAVDVDSSLKDKTPPGGVLFVFAKRIEGAGPPLAAKRIPLAAFPIQVQLSDADSVMPTDRLFSQSGFVLQARISVSGTAEAGAGDWQSAPITMQSDKLAPVTLILRQNP
ncbi:MAG: tetratricopeptide repeat protein [Arenimonas sp.]|jgi:cytochrome c-type biogenesis protein CcmH